MYVRAWMAAALGLCVLWSPRANAGAAAIAIDYPSSHSIFPPEITPPTFPLARPGARGESLEN